MIGKELKLKKAKFIKREAKQQYIIQPIHYGLSLCTLGH
jgi:hypothetical protein